MMKNEANCRVAAVWHCAGHLLVNGHTGEVAHVLVGTGEGVKERRLMESPFIFIK